MSPEKFIEEAFQEDFLDISGRYASGDHSSLSTISENHQSSAYAVAKEAGIIAGVELAKQILKKYDADLEFSPHVSDGQAVQKADLLFTVKGATRNILRTERIVLNFMQRMSGIASLTHAYVKAIEDTNVKILDTRKTTPNFRYFEKWAVRIGGGYNHRMGLYDMVMIKDNHIDFCDGIENAIKAVHKYLQLRDMHIPVEIEARSIRDVKQILDIGFIDRIMLDNFSPEQVKEAVLLINKKYETEVSGNISLENIRTYAEAKPDFISVGALTHSYKSLDISLKAAK